MRRHNPPSGIQSLLSNLLHGMDIDTRIKEQTCILVWDEVVGEQVASAAQPEFIKDGRMFVTTKSPVWANELTFYKSDMIARLNRRVGGQVLEDIIFKAGRINRRMPAIVEEDPSPLEGIQLSDLELDTVESAARGAGEDASEMMSSLLTTALRLEKWKAAHGWTPCRACGALQNTESGVCPVCGMNTDK